MFRDFEHANGIDFPPGWMGMFEVSDDRIWLLELCKISNVFELMEATVWSLKIQLNIAGFRSRL